MSKKTRVTKSEQKDVSAWIRTMAHEGKNPKKAQTQAIAYSKVKRGERPPKSMIKKSTYMRTLKQQIIEKLAAQKASYTKGDVGHSNTEMPYKEGIVPKKLDKIYNAIMKRAPDLEQKNRTGDEAKPNSQLSDAAAASIERKMGAVGSTNAEGATEKAVQAVKEKIEKAAMERWIKEAGLGSFLGRAALGTGKIAGRGALGAAKIGGQAALGTAKLGGKAALGTARAAFGGAERGLARAVGASPRSAAAVGRTRAGIQARSLRRRATTQQTGGMNLPAHRRARIKQGKWEKTLHHGAALRTRIR